VQWTHWQWDTVTGLEILCLCHPDFVEKAAFAASFFMVLPVLLIDFLAANLFGHNPAVFMQPEWEVKPPFLLHCHSHTPSVIVTAMVSVIAVVQMPMGVTFAIVWCCSMMVSFVMFFVCAIAIPTTLTAIPFVHVHEFLHGQNFSPMLLVAPCLHNKRLVSQG